MRSRFASTTPRVSLMGLGLGLALGVTAGLLAAPMRGREMRASLRTRSDQARKRALLPLEDGRRAFRRADGADGATPRLTAPMGEIAQMHPGAEPARFEAHS